ncbi:hypothetical protein [Pantoea sp. KPR_PJ]|uniref:hypothetical protein n=1 Tax=Pantoea sp. KPR_PJ TaxID=2738375 RepID=UPI003528AFA7
MMRFLTQGWLAYGSSVLRGGASSVCAGPRRDTKHRWPPPSLPDHRLTPHPEIDVARPAKNLQAAQALPIVPPVKTHKSLFIARRQRASGASGIMVSKPSEEEMFIRSDARDVLLAYPNVRAESIAALLSLAARYQATLTWMVDAPHGIAAIAAARRQ